MNKKLKWHDWNEEVFKKAREDDRLILLDITASWCHWCHVMDSTTYEDEEVIKYIEDNYIPVRVDRDKRPDIDGTYNLGGWPSTVILSSDGDIMTGGTYMPPKSLLYMLKDIYDSYKEHREDITKISEDQKHAARTSLRVKPVSRNLEHDVREYVLNSAEDMFDSKYGGFGKKPKFLYPELLSYLIGYYSMSADGEIKNMLVNTLDIMYGSKVYDRVEGGFFRYATQRDFSDPHYEKLLDDNARLMSIYLGAYQMFNLPRYMDAAEGILEYIKNNLYDNKKGLFYGSMDADEAYYSADIKQRAKFRKPAVDKTFYTDKNSLCIIAILNYYRITGKAEYLQMAMRAADALSKDLTDENGLMKHYPQSDNANILEDQICMSDALLKLYNLTGSEMYLNKSMILVDKAIEEFYDGKDKGFFDFLSMNEISNYQPSKSLNLNSEISKILMRLFLLTDSRKYYQYCKEALAHFSCIYREYGVFAVDYAEAVSIFSGNAYRIILAGKMDDHDTVNLYNALNRLYSPLNIVQFLDLENNEGEIKKMGLDSGSYPQIYVCSKDKCLPPIDNIEDLKCILRAREGIN